MISHNIRRRPGILSADARIPSSCGADDARSHRPHHRPERVRRALRAARRGARADQPRARGRLPRIRGPSGSRGPGVLPLVRALPRRTSDERAPRVGPLQGLPRRRRRLGGRTRMVLLVAGVGIAVALNARRPPAGLRWSHRMPRRTPATESRPRPPSPTPHAPAAPSPPERRFRPNRDCGCSPSGANLGRNPASRRPPSGPPYPFSRQWPPI